MTAIPKLRAVPSGSWRATRQRYLQWFEPTRAWRFRRAVPKHLRAIIGKREWTETLQARTEAEAIRLVLPHIEKTDRIIALADAGNWPAVPDEDVHDLAFAWWTGEPGAQTLSSGEIARSVERFLIGPRKLGGWLENSPMLVRTRERVLAILDDPDRNAAIRRNPDTVSRLLRECRRYRAVHALQNGGVEPFDVVTPAGGGTQAVVVPLDAANGSVRVFPPLSLGGAKAKDDSDLVSKWAKETDPDVRWLYQTRLTMRKLAALVGHDDATRVTRNDVIRFKEESAEKGLAAGTINRYLSEIKGPFAWAFKNEKIGTDPSEGVVFARKSQGKSARRGYTDEQARLILSAARDENQPFLRWIPWVCCFGGTRLDEVAGRNVADIQKIGSYYILDIPNGKTSGSTRKVPLHPALVRERFIDDYVESLPKNGPLFPDLRPDRFGRRAGTATKKIGAWLRRLQKETGVLLVEKTRYAPNHSWRHRFKSEARRVRMEEEVHDALTGHREGRGRVSRDYGEYYITSVLGPAIDSMLSPFDLPEIEHPDTP